MFRKFLPRRPGPMAMAGYVVLFLALGGSALAATRGFIGSDGQIHGCVGAKGALTVLKAPGTNCGAGKTAIAWNRKGPKGDAGPGATSIPITHLNPNGDERSILMSNGVEILFRCTASNQVALLVYSVNGGPVYVSGEKAENGVLSAVNASSSGTIGASGTATANLDVIATANGTWSRLDLGGYNGGAGGCNFWGLLIPGT
jgi:hypothetical protein